MQTKAAPQMKRGFAQMGSRNLTRSRGVAERQRIRGSISLSVPLCLCVSFLFCFFVGVSAGAAEVFDVVIRNGRIVDGNGRAVVRRPMSAFATARSPRSAASRRIAKRSAIDANGPDRRARLHRHDGPDGDARCSTTPRSAHQPADAGHHDDQRRRRGLGRAARRGRSHAAAAGGRWPSIFACSTRRDCRSTWRRRSATRRSAGSCSATSIAGRATPRLEQMRELVREAMEAGAIGVSTALIYPPAVYRPDRGNRQPRRSRRPIRRPLLHAHAERRRPARRSDRRSPRDRPPRQNAGPHLSSQDGRPAELGQDAARDRQDQSGPRRRPAGDGRHLSLHQQRPRHRGLHPSAALRRRRTSG